MPNTHVLAFHAVYRCRDSGRCCSSGWPIPVEADRLPAIERAVADGLVRPSQGTVAAVRPPAAPPETPAVLATDEGRCVFHRPGAPRSCALHRTLGHEALPVACRQFPRVSVIDPRGASVTLSHYCPTAAGLLTSKAPVQLVTDADAFPADGTYVGLDTREGIPPLLRPDMAMDWTAWWAWERRALAVLDAAPTATEALAQLDRAVEHVRTWLPTAGPLDRVVGDAFLGNGTGTGPVPPSPDALLQEVLGTVPDDLRPTANIPGEAEPDEGVRLRFLASHAFASWTAHLGLGLRTWLRGLRAADALLRLGLGVGPADLLLRHLADPHALSRTWSAAERE